MTCWNKLLLVWILLGSMNALCDELPPNQSRDLSPAVEMLSLSEEEDDDEDDDGGMNFSERMRSVEQDIKDLVRYSKANTPHGFSEIRLAAIELYIIRLKLYRLTGVAAAFTLTEKFDPPYSILFNRDMFAIELKEVLDKEGGDKLLTGKSIPLSADSEVIRDILTSADVNNFRELIDNQSIRDYNYLKEQEENYLRGGAVKPNCTFDALSTVYHRKKIIVS